MEINKMILDKAQEKASRLGVPLKTVVEELLLEWCEKEEMKDSTVGYGKAFRIWLQLWKKEDGWRWGAIARQYHLHHPITSSVLSWLWTFRDPKKGGVDDPSCATVFVRKTGGKGRPALILFVEKYRENAEKTGQVLNTWEDVARLLNL